MVNTQKVRFSNLKELVLVCRLIKSSELLQGPMWIYLAGGCTSLNPRKSTFVENLQQPLLPLSIDPKTLTSGWQDV